MPNPVTIKQAKAAYKSRAASTNTLSEREKKQLERSAALDRRAWGLREKEKARVEAVKKRAEREKLEREGRRNPGEEEKRRRDRHGFLASQLCLGAFFGRGGGRFSGMAGERQEKQYGDVAVQVGGEADDRGVVTEGEQKDGVGFDVGGDTEEEEFEEVDDDSLLEALKSPEVQQKKPIPEVLSRKFGDMLPPPPPQPRLAQAQQRQPPSNDRRSPRLAPLNIPHLPDPVWTELDFLDSSTQIARELESVPPRKPETQQQQGVSAHPKAQPELPRQPHVETKKADACNTSFGSCGSFDLTEADLEELDPTPPTVAKDSPGGKAEVQAECARSPSTLPAPEEANRERARLSMPPPALPLKNSAGNRAAGLPVKKHSSQRTSMPPPARPCVSLGKRWTSIAKTRGRVVPPRGDQRSAKGESEMGIEDKENSFTLTELESFVEEDLQLTQAC